MEHQSYSCLYIHSDTNPNIYHTLSILLAILSFNGIVDILCHIPNEVMLACQVVVSSVETLAFSSLTLLSCIEDILSCFFCVF